MNKSVLLSPCILLLVIVSGNTERILGCGGFLKSKASIDYSRVEVRLITPGGIQKYQTECAPNNGYYMIPFIEKGDFVLQLRPPNGWTFEPTSITIHVDGENDPCSQGKDINFEFLGFSVKGQVKSVGLDDGGPDGVTLKLMKDDSTEATATTLSTKGGSFEFQSVFPGLYKIRASHKSFRFEQNEVRVTVAEDTVHCDRPLVVSGYVVQGKVTVSNLPAKNVHLLLFSHQKADLHVEGCSKTPPSGSEDILNSKGLYFICSMSSNGDGHFAFSNLKPSEYVLMPFHKGNNTEFDVEPKLMKFSITHSDVVLPEPFVVTGFSVTGLVVNAAGPDGRIIPGVEVFVDGTKQAVTDKNGFYRLQSMTSGSYEISVVKKDYVFPTSVIRVGLDTPRLPTIVAERFSLCGQVHIKNANVKSFDIQKVEMHITANNGGKKITKQLDRDGTFCFQQIPGDYILEPIVTSAPDASSVQFYPALAKVTLAHDPKKDIEFHQILLSVEVSFSCIVSCSGARVRMLRVGEAESSAVQKKVSSSSNNIVFQNLLPGKYEFFTDHESWCWDKNQTKIDIQHGKKNSVAFRQTGFKLICSVSHDVDVVVYHHEKPVNAFHLTKGKNQLCVAEQGEYVIKPKSCHVFEKEKFVYHTSNPQPVLLQAIAHVLTIKVTSNHNDPRMNVIVKSNNHDKEFQLTPELEKSKDAQEVSYIIEYKAVHNEKLTIIPQSTVLLFEPKSFDFVVHTVSCDQDIVNFKAFKGLFIEGRVVPAIKDVVMTITTDQPGSTTLECSTDVDGKYKYGPLDPHVSYSITAKKEGYALTPSTENKANFEAKKFSTISFSVHGDDENQNPLKDVFITISGGLFRSNNLTDDQGQLLLRNLEPGEYYFKAVMKEYDFIPSSKVVKLSEGEDLNIKIAGKRVAYSCYGSVHSLNGQPEPDIAVQAFSITGHDGHAEETKTDEQGNFCIKGLLPNFEYKVTVRQTDNFERFSPLDVKISVNHEDITDMHFIAFRTQSQFEVSGHVVANNEYLKSLKVALYRRSDISTPIATAALNSPFFHFPSLPRDNNEYQVVLETTLDKTRYTFTEPAASFYAAGSYKHVVLEFKPEAKTLDLDTPQASYLTLPLTILILLIVYNHTKVRSVLEKLYASQVSDNVETAKQPGRRTKKEK